jgi:oligopeptide/dipeptide ABC transporter ATP-binding protein
VGFPSDAGPIIAVDKLDLTIAAGEVLGLVGESGCGKTMLARSILRLVAWPGRIAGGEILFEGKDLVAIAPGEMRLIRGDRIALVPQEPMTSLNPAITVGDQLTEVLRTHRPGVSRTERVKRAIALMEQVGIPFATRRLGQYPHELSGGIRQRVMIAMALMCGNVQLLIADEPTTALDVTTQAQILDLFQRLQAAHHMAVMLITHDLAVVAQVAHRVAVMYAGSIVELSAVGPLFDSPMHPYTRGLLQSVPRRGIGTPKAHLAVIAGAVPNLATLPEGCKFYDRCQYRMDSPCRTVRPALEEAERGRWVRCHRWRDLPHFELSAGVDP